MSDSIKTSAPQTLQIDMSGRGGFVDRQEGDLDRSTPNPNIRYITSSSKNPYSGSTGYMVSGYYNPLRRYGYLSAANGGMTTVDQGGTVFDAIPNCVVYDQLGNMPIVGELGRYFKALNNGLDDLQFYSGSVTGDLTATGSPKIYDLEIYTINNVRKLFTAYIKSGNIDIATSALAYDTGSITTAVFSGEGGGTIGGNYTLFMRVADNGFMYVFGDSYVHKFDGTTTGGSAGTVTPNVLIFPASFTITDAVDFHGDMFIALVQAPGTPESFAKQDYTYSLPCGIYVWDRQTTTTGSIDYIPFFGARVIHKVYINGSGVLRAMVTNALGILEIREYNGNTFDVLCEVGQNAYPTFLDSVASVGDLVIWLAASGDIWMHGSIAPGEVDGLYRIGILPEAANRTGFVFFGGGNDFTSTTGFKTHRTGLYVGYQDASNAIKVKQWDLFGTGAASTNQGTNVLLAGNVMTPVTFLPPMSVVKDITIIMAQGSGSGTTTAGTFNIYLNGSSVAWASKIVTRDEHARGYKRIEVNKPYINSIQIETVWPTNVATQGNFDVAPALAVIEYDSSVDKG